MARTAARKATPPITRPLQTPSPKPSPVAKSPTIITLRPGGIHKPARDKKFFRKKPAGKRILIKGTDPNSEHVSSRTRTQLALLAAYDVTPLPASVGDPDVTSQPSSVPPPRTISTRNRPLNANKKPKVSKRSKPFRFLDLPAEIRIKIYTVILPDWNEAIDRMWDFKRELDLAHTNHDATGKYYQRPQHRLLEEETQLYTPSLLLINKQTSREVKHEIEKHKLILDLEGVRTVSGNRKVSHRSLLGSFIRYETFATVKSVYMELNPLEQTEPGEQWRAFTISCIEFWRENSGLESLHMRLSKKGDVYDVDLKSAFLDTLYNFLVNSQGGTPKFKHRIRRFFRNHETEERESQYYKGSLIGVSIPHDAETATSKHGQMPPPEEEAAEMPDADINASHRSPPRKRVSRTLTKADREKAEQQAAEENEALEAAEKDEEVGYDVGESDEYRPDDGDEVEETFIA
ncbi:hypothetical protein LTS18_008360 [Coniosporium uncinatum]|uniref:Uncharacterized protein n=1 Tax=Coniosporium uncinatum TaxID=93489 RepID=A0ACC3DWT6_9PEZI|nr:hypothetical protein LTS18_008360 [Coniosporium uncinatum]